MPENLFETMTSADFMAFLAEIPVNERTGSAFFLIGWFMADLTDAARGRAASELLRHSGATVIPFHRETPASGSSPLSR